MQCSQSRPTAATCAGWSSIIAMHKNGCSGVLKKRNARTRGSQHRAGRHWEASSSSSTSSGNTNAIDGGKESISDSPGHMLKVAEGLPYCTKVPLRAGGWPRMDAEL